MSLCRCGVFVWYSYVLASTESVMPSYRVQQILNFTAGFLMFKVATIITVLVSDNMTKPHKSDKP